MRTAKGPGHEPNHAPGVIRSGDSDPCMLSHMQKTADLREADQYEDDILLWSERQADLLRRRAIDDLDFDNLAEEIADVGKSELHAVESLLEQALLHMLKAEAWPQARDAPSWRAEAIGFRRQARKRFTPSMRQRIDVAEMYDDALAALPETNDGQPPGLVWDTCPMTLDELLSR
jgi:hypothetical protein